MDHCHFSTSLFDETCLVLELARAKGGKEGRRERERNARGRCEENHQNHHTRKHLELERKVWQTNLFGRWLAMKINPKSELAGKGKVKNSEGLGGYNTVWHRVNKIFCVLEKNERR